MSYNRIVIFQKVGFDCDILSGWIQIRIMISIIAIRNTDQRSDMGQQYFFRDTA